MYWLCLLTAGLFEVVMAYGLKLCTDAPRMAWVAITALATVLSMGLLSFSMKQVPLGTAYCVWTGIGAVGTFLMGVAFFSEPASVPRVICVLLVIAGVMGLRIFS